MNPKLHHLQVCLESLQSELIIAVSTAVNGERRREARVARVRVRRVGRVARGARVRVRRVGRVGV